MSISTDLTVRERMSPHSCSDFLVTRLAKEWFWLTSAKALIHCVIDFRSMTLQQYGVILVKTLTSIIIHYRFMRGSRQLRWGSRPRGYKTFFMLNSADHEIYPAHKC